MADQVPTDVCRQRVPRGRKCQQHAVAAKRAVQQPVVEDDGVSRLELQRHLRGMVAHGRVRRGEVARVVGVSLRKDGMKRGASVM